MQRAPSLTAPGQRFGRAMLLSLSRTPFGREGFVWISLRFRLKASEYGGY